MLAAAVIAVLIWLLQSPTQEPQVASSDRDDVTATAQGLVSAIRPVSEASAQDAAQTGILFNSLDPDIRSGLVSRFSEALSAQTQGDYVVAEELLSTLIKDYPQLSEPYVNLAAVYSKTNQLEKAQATLVSGLNANPTTAVLFESLQQVHGAQAAESYQKALSDTVVTAPPLDLPLVSKLVLSPLPQTESPEQAEGTKLAALQVASLNQEISNLKSQYESRIVSLQNELSNQKLLADNNLTALTSLQVATPAPAPAPAKVTPQTEEVKQIPQIDLVAQAREKAEEKRQQALAEKKLAEKVLAKSREQNAIKAVQRWATAWSSQDVTNYVGSYADDYVPNGSDLSHDAWVRLRRDRLSNKKFISVKVSGFNVEDLGERFSVRFSQNYKSNTINDTITKKLTFIKGDKNWLNSKIVNENVVSG